MLLTEITKAVMKFNIIMKKKSNKQTKYKWFIIMANFLEALSVNASKM